MESLKKELEAMDKNAVRGVEEKRKLREQYEEKVKKITTQLVSLKKQRWEQESQRLERQKAKSDIKVPINSLPYFIDQSMTIGYCYMKL